MHARVGRLQSPVIQCVPRDVSPTPAECEHPSWRDTPTRWTGTRLSADPASSSTDTHESLAAARTRTRYPFTRNRLRPGKPHGGKLRVALAFPNTYFWVGMSNLGFQTVYRLFNAQPDIVCERVFLPPKQELAAQSCLRCPAHYAQSQTPVRDFDVFAFSVSFEWDYVNVVTLMRPAGIKGVGV